MSSVLSAPPSLVDMDHTDAPSFTRDPSSSSSSSVVLNNQQGSPKHPASNSPPRPAKSESVASPSPCITGASPNGHVPEPEEDNRQLPPSPSQHSPEEQAVKISDEEHATSTKDETDRDDANLLPGSDPDDDPDLGSGESDGDWSQDDIEADIRRVKVYELVGQKWTDRGTAFCQGDYDEDARQARLIARAEHTNEILLQCIIRTNDVYQRQEETLIVWTEPDGTDYALSFQDIEGCGEVWEFIAEVQRHLQEKEQEAGSSDLSGSTMHMFPAGTMNPLSITFKLPIPVFGNVQECERTIKQISRQPHGKEKLYDLLITNDYVKRIVEIMKQAEDVEDIKELHACCSCMQTILLVNDHNLYDYILQEHMFLGVIGVLEYDPEFPTHKACYREFLETSAHFRQPIPIRDAVTRNKIHRTYRLQFLKDFILARATDDATFNMLNSCIIFNQIDIVNHVQQDERFLRELVGLFLTAEQETGGNDKESCRQVEKAKAKHEVFSDGQERPKDGKVSAADEESKANGDASCHSPEIGPQPAPAPPANSASTEEYTADERRKDIILLIQQLCLMGKNVQLPARLQLFRTLVDRGILHAVQWALGRPEPQMISTAGEVLGVLLDHDLNGVRHHVMRQVGVAGKPTMGVSVGLAGPSGDALGADGKRETLLETLCRSLTNSNEVAYKSQMADALRAVLDVPQSDGTESTNLITPRAMTRPKDDPVTERFLEYFYEKCCENLFRPMAELPEHHKVREPTLRLSRERSNLYLYLCDLLSSFALQHSFRSHFFIVSSSNAIPALVSRIASLLRAREKHLRLAALRFFRACLKLSNRNVHLHLIKHDVIFPILELTAREAKRDNLLSSCCQEFFEHIRVENIKELLTHLMTKYEAKVKELADSPVCGERFQKLIRRWEMNNEPPPLESEKPQTSVPPIRRWGQGRLLEAEEEDYFNNSDDEEPPKTNNTSWSPVGSVGSVNTLKRKRARGFPGITAGPLPKAPRPVNAVMPRLSQSLVDYDEDDEDAESVASPSKTGGDATIPAMGYGQAGSSPPPDSPPPPRPIDWFASSSHVFADHSPSEPKGGRSAPDIDDDPTSIMSRGDPLPRPVTPPRLGEKRRRGDEDDEDGMMERLVKSKKPHLATPAATPTPSTLTTSSSASVEDLKSLALPKTPTPGGKMRLKLRASSLSLASGTPSGVSPDQENKDDGG